MREKKRGWGVLGGVMRGLWVVIFVLSLDLCGSQLHICTTHICKFIQNRNGVTIDIRF